MEAITTPPRAAPLRFARNIDPAALGIWALGFGLVVYLGLKGGGYDPLITDQAGIALWWVALAAVLIGALPRRRPGFLALSALLLLIAFVAWTGLSLGWTDSVDRTSADLARLATYLGAFALALFLRDAKSARRLVAAVGAGIAVVSIVALLSRLHPAWFSAVATSRFLPSSRERLSYPLDYWNGLAALIAIGLPLMLWAASCARTTVFRAIAAALLPAMALTVFLTVSRGGIAASALALAVFIAFSPDRLPKLLTMIPAGTGAGILIASAARREALQQGLSTPLAHHQGDQMLAISVVVCVGVGLLVAALTVAETQGLRPRWTYLPRRRFLALAGTGLLALILTAAVLNAPQRISHAWSNFKGAGAGPAAGTARLGSTAGEGRYQFWRAALHEEESKPLTGTGSGTFEFWWDRHGTTASIVRDTHSLYFQTLGELGIVGLAVLGAFLLVVLLGGAIATLRAGPLRRPALAAALAGCAAFCLTAAFDWVWQIPVIAIAVLLLASVPLGYSGAAVGPTMGLPLALRACFCALALAGIVAIAIPLASAGLLRQSQADALASKPSAALGAARSAEDVQPYAAAPRLQEALLLEVEGHLAPAGVAARAAVKRGPADWRNWLVLSRIEAERGLASASLRDYRQAKSLNPRSYLFAR